MKQAIKALEITRIALHARRNADRVRKTDSLRLIVPDSLLENEFVRPAFNLRSSTGTPYS